MFGSRWRAYASPIRALFEAAKPELVARIMSGAMENAVARRLTPEAVHHQAREMLPDELPPEPGAGWIAGFEAAAKLSNQELISNAKAFDEASKRWSSGSSSSSGSFIVKLSEAVVGEQLERIRGQLRGDSLHERRPTPLGDGPPVYDRVEDDADPRRHEWAQLRACGMLHMANTVLHAFGWAIVVTDDGDAYPARTSSRGFTEVTQAQAHRDIAGYLRLAGDAMVAETEPEEGPF
jgi:hypothetical protein